MPASFADHAAQRAPRYTSFPPAGRFGPSVDQARFGAWLSELDPSTELALYLHVPFCREICWYCGCETFAARRAEPLQRFVETLIAEIDLVAARMPARRVTQIVWGGGTPNLLPVELHARLFDHLADRLDLREVRRHAIELDPRYLTPEKASFYVGRGVRSASLGVQDLNPHVQQAIGRLQEFAVVAAAVQALRDAGFDSLGLDLMYGLPQQTTQDVLVSLEGALTLAPDRIAIFGYDHAPEHRPRQRRIEAARLPEPAARLAQATAMRERLQAAGYESVGVDHFVRPHDPLARAARDGRLKRDFHGYGVATGAPIVGLGPSGISEFDGGYAQNADSVTPWRRAVLEGRLATVRGHVFDDADRRRRAVIQDLLCSFAADLSGLGPVLEQAEARLARLQADGLVLRDGTRLSIAPEARPLARLVAAAFDPDVEPSAPFAL